MATSVRDLGWLVRPLVSWVSVALFLSACGGNADPLSPLVSGEAMAALAVIDTRADHRPVTATVFEEADDGLPLEMGDAVRTDATGFAEIVYADGSLTRLDGDTTFTVLALDGDVTVPEIETRLDGGRIWNRVNSVTAQRGRFEVETSVGVATVRGTAFGIECIEPGECTFTVTEGVVVVITPDGQEIEIAAGEAVTIGIDGGGRGDDGAGAGAGGSGGGSSEGSAAGSDGDATAADDTTDGNDGTPDGSATPAPDDPAGMDSGEDVQGPDGSVGADGSNGSSSSTGITVSRQPADGGTDDGGTGIEVWTGRNATLDEATRRFGGDRESCSVTVGGRNINHATSPDTAIDVHVDETLYVDAVATGPLESYRVDLRFAGIAVRAAQGEVLPDTSGDRTGFRGEVDVRQYARWGVGLYEVHATTSGTRCDALAFVNVIGRNPLTTGSGVAALLLALGGTAGLIAAINLATGDGTATVREPPSPTEPRSTSTTAVMSPTSFTSDGAKQGSDDAEQEDPSTSWLRRITDVFRSDGGSGR